ncbi:MAG: hypothetical protein CMB41_02900 [Euryarchaeota archaeon]|nr:hypothetical protein [Euryarchaeota archaeon]
MGEDAPLVTITVCVRNGADWVEGCMQSLLEQTWRPLEIVAVDDGSSDGSDERLQAFHDPDGEVPVRVLRRPAEGLAAARNAAARAARGTWIAITDIDVRPMPDWIEALMAARNGLENEDVMAVTGRTIFEEGDDLVSRLRSIEIERKYRSRPRRTSLANGPCSMFRADALLEVGGFEPAWYHAEDMEVSLNMVAAGGTIVYTPEAMVRHVPEEGRQRFAAKRRRDARAHVRIARRWPRRARKGMRFDFLGTPLLVLAMMPLRLATWACFIAAIGPAVLWWTQNGTGGTDGILPPDPAASFAIASTFWVGAVLLAEATMWFSALGAVTREVLSDVRRRKRLTWLISRESFALRMLLLSWSWALWRGLVLGGWDAVTGRNGHRRR